MTDAQRSLALAEATNYTDVDAFVSDLLLSDAFLPADDPSAEPDLSQADELRRLWTVSAAPFRALLEACGLTAKEASTRYCINPRTVYHWLADERPCPLYVRLMLALLTGYLREEAAIREV